MKSLLKLVLFGLVLLAPYEAAAMSGKGSVCTDNQNARDEEECLQPALKSADAALRKKLGAVSKWLKGTPEEVKLERNQGLWEQYVRDTCSWLVKFASADEPIGYVDVLSCKVELTLERTRDLDRLFYVPLHD